MLGQETKDRVGYSAFTHSRFSSIFVRWFLLPISFFDAYDGYDACSPFCTYFYIFSHVRNKGKN